jgi:6-phosphogluconolactonase (cycloisomerase 2 family)
MSTFVFAGSAGLPREAGGTVTGFRLNPDGRLVSVPGSPFKTSNTPRVLRSDPQGRFLFIAEDNAAPGGNCVDEPGALSVERVNPASGALSQADRITLRGSCVRDIAIDPSGRHLYVGVENVSTSGGAIQEFSIGATGRLTELASSPVMVEDLPVSFAMHPNGRFLFAATPNLTVLDRDPGGGELSVRAVFSTPKQRLVLDSTRTVLTARERDTKEISEFQVDSAGNVSVERQGRAKPPFFVADDPLLAIVTPQE